MKEISEKRYLLNRNDKEPTVFRNCLGKEKKAWCAYQLQYNSKILVQRFARYCKLEGFKKCSLYGNGTLTKELLPILVQAEIRIETNYDQNYVQDSLEIGHCQIKTTDINKTEVIEGILLNTVVNYGAQVAVELSEKFTTCKVLDLYELLWFLLR